MGKNKSKKSSGNKQGDHGYSNRYKKKDKQPPMAFVSVQPATQTVPEKTAVNADTSSSNSVQTQQQKRAGYALEKVKSIIDELKNDTQEEQCKKCVEFKNQASSLPAMILMNGLGQAAAFYLSKGDIHEKLYTLMSDWLIQDGQPYAGKLDLMSGITEMDMTHYHVAQAEALMLLDWVKKFANAFVRK